MPKIDNITYPDADEALLGHRHLGKMFYQFLKKRMAEENADFLLAVARKRDPKSQYPIFFAPSSRTQLNVASSELLKAKELGDKKDWRSKDWGGIYNASIKQARTHLIQNFQLDFYKSKEFKAYHARALRKVIRIPAKLKQELAIEDDGLLADTVVLFMSDKRAGARAANALVAKKKTSRNAKEVAKAIGKFFKVA